MDKEYVRINWQNEPSVSTPLGAINLNKMDYMINENENNIIQLDLIKANQNDLNESLRSVSYNTTTGVFIFTYWNGNTLEADLNIEKIPVSFSMSPEGVITMVTSDGSVYTADIASLIKTYTFADSDEIDFDVTTDSSGNKNITASIVSGSITGDKLQPNYLADCVTAKNDAESASSGASASATQAGNSSLDAEAWAIGKRNGVDVPSTDPAYHNNSKYWSEQAATTTFAGLDDVELNNLQNGQVPKWDATAQKWKNGTGGGGSENYNDLTNKPSVNGVELSGNKTSSDLGLQGALPAAVNDRYLHTNATTGALEWSAVQGGGGDLPEYTMAEYEEEKEDIEEGTQFIITDDYMDIGSRYSTFNVTIPSAMVGDTFIVSKGSESHTVVASSTLVIFYISGCGTYTITNTTKSQSMGFDAPYFGIYEVSFDIMNFNGWLQAGGIIQSFANLDAVLADEPTIRILMTKHDAVDYLSAWLNYDTESATKILNDDYCAKWINLRDYALDTLYANNTCKTIMDTADKYFYGEWGIVDNTTVPPTWGALGNVPVMTSNTAPYGEASASHNATNCEPYKAFDNDSSTAWETNDSGFQEEYIRIKFTNPICVKKLKTVNKNVDNRSFTQFYIKASNDGTTWQEIKHITSGVNTQANATNVYDVRENDDYYLYYEIYSNYSSEVQTGNHYGYSSIQFYGRELKVSVPKMTSNTAPWGEAMDGNPTADSYKAFDNNTDTFIRNNVTFDFKQPVVVKMVSVLSYMSDKRIDTYDICGSNDNENWVTLGRYIYPSIKVQYDIVDNDTPYRYYKGIAYNSVGAIMSELQFYGLDYSEHDERHYIYDHGIELEELYLQLSAYSYVEKRSNDIHVTYTHGGSTHYIGVWVANKIDFTGYSLLRGRYENKAGDLKNSIATNRDSINAGTVFSEISITNYVPNIATNISSVNGEHYLTLGSTYYNGNNGQDTDMLIKEYWLE